MGEQNSCFLWKWTRFDEGRIETYWWVGQWWQGGVVGGVWNAVAGRQVGDQHKGIFAGFLFFRSRLIFKQTPNSVVRYSTDTNNEKMSKRKNIWLL